ncbi:MAG: hypothetical protein WB440_08630 [Steroidobacteraceae bacterium]|jgi:hypothetical protein
MSKRTLEALSDRERACLAHLEEAKKLGVSFSQYCREKAMSMHQWTWIKRALVRKGVIAGARRPKSKPAAFVPVRIAPVATVTPSIATTVCRIRHPSGWMIECASYPDVSWMSAVMSGEAR